MSIRRVTVGCAAVAFAGLAAAPVWAATYPPVGPTPTTSVEGVQSTQPQVQPSNSSLPFTGADIAAITAAGVASIAVGALAVGAAKRRRGEHT